MLVLKNLPRIKNKENKGEKEKNNLIFAKLTLLTQCYLQWFRYTSYQQLYQLFELSML
jgi:hypothetical protein